MAAQEVYRSQGQADVTKLNNSNVSFHYSGRIPPLKTTTAT